MNELKQVADILAQNHGAAIDRGHAVLMLGALLAAKPESVLEIGIGTGTATKTILEGLAFNGVGQLTCVDNYWDLGGNLPHEVLESIAKRGVTLKAPINEKDFVLSCPDDSYDFLVSDGDHEHAGEWADEIFRIMKPNSFMFFHDIANTDYPNLQNYLKRAIELGKPHFLFSKSSRSDENCGRGWLMIINEK